MYAQAPLSVPVFDPLLPATDRRLPNRPAPAALPRKSSTYEPMHSQGEPPLSMAKLHERLTMLAQLELPCTILATNPPLYLREAVIKTVELAGDGLTVGGNGFSLHLRRPHIHSIRLLNQRAAGGGAPSLDILHSQGMLYASIQPAPGGPSGEVWRDVMDNPTLSLA